MNLLHQIQEALTDAKSDLASTLLKTRLLADRLGSKEMLEWVKFEAEGYPEKTELPSYRHIPLTYTGNFHSIAWKAENQPLPSHLIEKFCGKAWLRKEVGASIASIESMIVAIEKGATMGIDASNVPLLIEGKIFPDMNCTSVTASMSPTNLQEIISVVKSRLLELTIQLEKELPKASKVNLEKRLEPTFDDIEKITQVFNVTVNGQSTIVSNSGDSVNITTKHQIGNTQALIDSLTDSGIPKEHAKELAKIAAKESPDLPENPMGKSVRDWLSEKFPKIVNGAWNMTSSTAMNIIEEALKNYYGL